MSEERLPPELEWPRWRWLSWPVVVFDLALAVTAFLWPDIGSFEQRFSIIIGLLSLMIILPTIFWFRRVSYVARERVRLYPTLYRQVRVSIAEANQARSSLLTLESDTAETYAQLQEARQTVESFVRNIQASQKYEIWRARVDRGKLVLVLKKRRGSRLQVGSQILAVRRDEFVILGRFEVTEIRSDSYYASSLGSVDRIIMSYIREYGEVSILPYTLAVELPTGETL